MKKHLVSLVGKIMLYSKDECDECFIVVVSYLNFCFCKNFLQQKKMMNKNLIKTMKEVIIFRTHLQFVVMVILLSI